jgi:hypothetical protein
MNWAENFWVWMATEAFFGLFVAALLYYFFVYKQRDINERNKKN